MGSALALAGATLRARVRSRGAIVAAAFGLAALVVAVLLPAGSASGAAAAAVESALVVVAAAAALSAAGSGDDLPAARLSGAGDWLATAAPSAVVRRVVPAFSGIALAVAAGLATAAVAAAFLAVTGRSIETHAYTLAERAQTAQTINPPGPDRSPVLGRTGRFTIPAHSESVVLETDFRPIFKTIEAYARPTVPVELAILVDASAPPAGPRWTSTRSEVAPRGTQTFLLEPAPEREVQLSTPSADVDLRVVAARLRGAACPFLGNVLLAGLLLGVSAACVVPFAVLVSRAVSGPTATAAAALVVLLGVLHAPLLELAADAAEAPGGALAGAILRAAVAVAPDLSAALRVEDVSLGRFLGPNAFSGLLPAAAHAAISFVLLAAIPGRRGAP